MREVIDAFFGLHSGSPNSQYLLKSWAWPHSPITPTLWRAQTGWKLGLAGWQPSSRPRGRLSQGNKVTWRRGIDKTPFLYMESTDSHTTHVHDKKEKRG